MKPTWKYMLLAGAMTIAPVTAHAAQEAPAAEAVAYAETEVESEAYTAELKAKQQREMDEAMAIIAKIFDTSHLPPIEPARLALAQQSSAALIPPGALAKMLDNMYGKVFNTFLEETGGLSDITLAIKTGVDSESVKALPSESRVAITDLFDPYRKERDEQMKAMIKPLIAEAMADLEPPMREGLAKAFARRFSADQLTQLNAFFATPTGGDFAGDLMALQADPEVMQAMVKAVPAMVAKFIERAPQVEGQFKELPKEKQLADLTDAELARLAGLMQVDVAVLRETRDMWSEAAMVEYGASDGAADAAEGAADAAEAAADAAMMDEGPWYDPANWDATERARIEELAAESDAASMAYYEAQSAAIAKARARLGGDSPAAEGE